jgi:hypothetical protein
MLTKTKQITVSVLRAMILVSTITALSSAQCYGQADTTKILKNTIRVNITNPMIFGWKFNVIGYERVIKDYQTASISFGRTAFPKLSILNTDSLGINEQLNDNGINLSLDYRFYLKNENKHKAPRGIYLGPYYGFNTFSRDITWNLDSETFTGDVKSEIDLTAHLIGAQMGVQFIFWNRISFDMIVMGPGWWYFNMKTKFDTSLTAEDEEMLLEKLNEMLLEKFPGSDIMITGDGFDATRSSWTSTAMLRYIITVGFRF